MIKETAIAVYLTVLGILFKIFSKLPLKEKTVMLSSFGDNMTYLIDDIKKESNEQIFVLKEARCKADFTDLPKDQLINFIPKNIAGLISGMYHLATSKYVFVDNYHVVLAACNFKPDVQCTQLWHANGAVKYFGYRDKTITKRPKSAHSRFKQVYSRFHNIVVSSDEMAYIFSEAFGASSSQILKTGMPRTDYFYNEAAMQNDQADLYKEMQQLTNKKVLLYAPTFRDNQFEVSDVQLDIKLMKQQLKDEYHLLLKLHPAVSLTEFEDDDFTTNVSNGFDINALMTVSDILITDYSSIPFEYSILNKPMIFFPYDLKDYESARGIWFNYESYMPGPTVTSTSELVSTIIDDAFDLNLVEKFNKQWNKYSDGHSSQRLVHHIYKK